MELRSKLAANLLAGAVILLAAGCAAAPEVIKPKVENYYPAYRQAAPEPVYSRLTWSNLPQGIINPPREKGPYLSPVISFELGDSTLQEAIEAISQTIGYQWSFPPEAAKRHVRVRMKGSVGQILSEIGRQADVEAEIDHQSRMVRVIDRSTTPLLPPAGEAGSDS